MTDARRTPLRPDRDLARAVKATKAPAISRAAAVLRLLGKSNAPMGVQSIARELGLVPSTCLHVLRALVAEEFVSFDPETKRYSLEAGVLTLARHWLRRNRFNDLAQPVLDRIGQAFDLTMLGVQIVGLEHIIVVAVSQSGHTLQLSTHIGSRFPARGPVQDVALGRSAHPRRMESASCPHAHAGVCGRCGQLYKRRDRGRGSRLPLARKAQPRARGNRNRQRPAPERTTRAPRCDALRRTDLDQSALRRGSAYELRF
jgi:hypothetical protein